MASPQPSPLPLGPVDHIVPKYYVVILLFFPADSLNITTAPQAFRSGLTRLLLAIPELGGTVQRSNDPAQNRAIQVTKPWRSADQILSVKDLRGQNHLIYSDLRKDHFPTAHFNTEVFTPPIVYSTALEAIAQASTLDKPVLLIQVNILKGGVALALCVYHPFTDGNGMATVIRTYAACCRGEDPTHLLSKDILNRQRTGYGGDIAHHGLGESGLWSMKPEKTGISARFSFLMGRLRASILRLTLSLGRLTSTNIWPYRNADFFFPKAKLAELKSMAILARSNQDKSQWISTSDALCSLLTCCLLTAMAPDEALPSTSKRSLDHHDESSGKEDPDSMLLMVINARRSMRPVMPVWSLGNLLAFESARASRSALTATESAVADFALSIRRSVQRADTDHFRRFSAALSAIPNIFDCAAFRRPADYGIKNLVYISSWRDQGGYEDDWGDVVGRVEKIRHCTISFPNLCIIMPEIKDDQLIEEERGLEVTVGLTRRQMQKLRGDVFFRRFATFRDE